MMQSDSERTQSGHDGRADTKYLLGQQQQPQIIISEDNHVKFNRFATAEERRRKALYDATQQSIQDQLTNSNRRSRGGQKAKRIVQKGWQSAKNIISKVNIGRWIDDLEHDQQVADELDRINRDNIEEEQRKKLVAQVHSLCMDAIREHLISYKKEFPKGSYERWIAELHPDNVLTGSNKSSVSDETKKDATIQIDPRFYVADSDHLLLWHQWHQLSQEEEEEEEKDEKGASPSSTEGRHMVE